MTGVSREPRERLGGVVLSVVRIIISFLFLLHGAAALFGVLTPGGMPTPVGLWPSWWAGLIQFVGGALVLVGLFTTPVALLCSGSMAYAYFTVHQPRGLLPIQNAGELAALYSWFFLLFAALGAGPFALDALLRRRRRAHAPVNATADETPGTGDARP
ncbi:DoxX family protein [Saccharopolyspora rosea]|uniref:DoxX family protein n=1 Tax=Saccharopolyspora rosea TaxID=524884 RepID=A0ABW3FXG0_9PSEU|nr:DoxX family protein [Saccharopolyspora rosea]